MLRGSGRFQAVALLAMLAAVCLLGASGLAYAEQLESELVVRTEADEQIIGHLAKTFEKKHPGTKVVYSTLGSMESLVKSFREMPNPQADILTTKAHLLIKGNNDSLKKFGKPLLEAYKTKNLPPPEKRADRPRLSLVHRALVRPRHHHPRRGLEKIRTGNLLQGPSDLEGLV